MGNLINRDSFFASRKVICGLFLLLLAGFAVFARGSDWTGFIFIGAATYFLFTLSPGLKDRRLFNILLLAFIIRLGFLLYSVYVEPFPVEGADSDTFENLAWRSAQAWLEGEPGKLRGGGRYYIAIIAVLYSVFGRVELIPRFVTLLAGMLTVLYTYKTAFFITDKQQAAQLSAFAAALYPTLVVYSAVLLREQFVILFFILSAYYFFNWIKTGSVLSMAISVAWLFISSLYHGGMIVIGFSYLLLFLVYSPQTQAWFNFKDKLALRLSAFGLLGGVFFVYWNYFRSKIPSTLFEGNWTAFYYDLAGSDLYARSVYLLDYVPSSIWDIIWHTPLRIFFFSMTPFPWQIEIFLDFPVFLDAFIFSVALILFFYSWRFIKPEQRAFYVGAVLIVLVFLAAFAWGTFNYGTAVRHRQKIVWLLFSYASLSVITFTWWSKFTGWLDKNSSLRFLRNFF